MVRSNGYEFKVLGHDPREFPEVPAFAEKGSLGVPREKFVEILRRVAVAASRDTARFQLNGVFFEVNGDKLLFTATDGKRLTHDYLRIENPNGISSSGHRPQSRRGRAPQDPLAGPGGVQARPGRPGHTRVLRTRGAHREADPGRLSRLPRGRWPQGQRGNRTAKRSDFLDAARERHA